MEYGRLDRTSSAIVGLGILELPLSPTFVVQQLWVVVPLVEEFEDRGEDFGNFVGEVDSFGARLEELAAADGGEEGRVGEDAFVACKQSCFGTDNECDYWGCQSTFAVRFFRKMGLWSALTFP